MTEINKIEPIYCLFHQQTNCSCLSPVTDKGGLIARLQREIKVNEFLNERDANSEAKSRRGTENLRLRLWLEDLLYLAVFVLYLLNC